METSSTNSGDPEKLIKYIQAEPDNLIVALKAIYLRNLFEDIAV